MPIDRDLLNSNPKAANAFLNEQRGAMLHEVSHYVAANIDGIIRGHVIIYAGADKRSGAFVPDDPSAELLSSNPARWSLVSSAGVLVELHFCNQARIGAAQADIAAYQSRFGLMPDDMVVARWKRDHLDRIATHAACIEKNFDRCVRHCRDGNFLIGDHHVIPTCILRSPRWRGLRARLHEAVLTYPMESRCRALNELLAARANGVVSQIT